ncbi:MAG: NnrU family protein [Variibacter sp.]|nr:NnrU family protein [Variibacter sp.]
MGLAILILGLVAFIGPHLLTTRRALRGDLIARWGEGPYKIAYSLAAAVGIALIAYGFGLYRQTGWVEIWSPPAWTRHLAVTLMWPAIIMIAAAYLPGRIKATLRHPMLAGLKLWALAHLLSNGDLGSIVLFGALLAWGVYDRIAVKRREAVEGRAVVIVSGWRNDIIAVVAGTLAYLALGLWFHPWVVGVPAFSR